MAISVLSFSFSMAAQTEGLRAHSARCWFSLPHLLTNWAGLQTNWLPVFTELYNSSIAHLISLERHVWSSSSGNNCHAVHKSLFSGASVYDCTMGFYLVPYCQPIPPARFLPITAIEMYHFLPVHHFGMACLAGSKVNIQHYFILAGTLWGFVNVFMYLIFLSYPWLPQLLLWLLLLLL